MEAAHNPWAVLLATAITLVLVGLLTVYYLTPNARSVLIEANTQFVHIPFAAEETWRLPEAVICRERERVRNPVATVEASGICGNDMEVSQVQSINWQDAAEVDVIKIAYNDLQIFVRSAHGSEGRVVRDTFRLEDGDRVLFPYIGRNFGPLLFSGDVRLGAIGPNSPILLKGEYEWRERLSFRDRPERIETDALRAGDIITVASGDCNSEGDASSGMVFPTPVDEPGLNVVLSAADSEPDFFAPLGLCLTRFGFEPTFIEPKWSARVLNDPMTYALGVLLTIALTVFPAILGMWNAFFRTTEE